MPEVVTAPVLDTDTPVAGTVVVNVTAPLFPVVARRAVKPFDAVVVDDPDVGALWAMTPAVLLKAIVVAGVRLPLVACRV